MPAVISPKGTFEISPVGSVQGGGCERARCASWARRFAGAVAEGRRAVRGPGGRAEAKRSQLCTRAAESDRKEDAGRDGQVAVHRLDGHSDPELGQGTNRPDHKPSVSERLKDVLNKPRERLESETEREVNKDREAENEREIDSEIDRDPGISH